MILDTVPHFAAVEITSDEYARLFDPYALAFNRSEFAMLNRQRAGRIRFLALTAAGHPPVAGIVLGERNGVWRSPFSAPFGGLTFHNAEPPRFSVMVGLWRAVAAIEPRQHIVIPTPAVYNPGESGKMIKAPLCVGYTMALTDLNFYLPCTAPDIYERSLHRNGRRNLAAARQAGLSFEQCPVGRAYAVIHANRVHRGWPLRMSLAQVEATSAIIRIDAFVVTTPSGDDVAAAIVYHVAPSTVQVVYWGNTPGFAHLKPVNFTAASLIAHYQARGMHTIDVGISTEDGEPNFGLCDFKESIGCLTSLKPTFTIDR